MLSEGLAAAQDATMASMVRAREILPSCGGPDLLDRTRFLAQLIRQAEYDLACVIGQLERDGEFTARGVVASAAVADLLGCSPRQARGLARVADALSPVTSAGEPLPPRLPATAVALAGFEIDVAHAEVIDRALGSDAARRIPLEKIPALETQLATFARDYRPDQLARMAEQLIDALDQDGPEPRDEPEQTNELFLSKSTDGVGGRIKGRLDSATFDVLSRAVHASLVDDREKSLAERQADALGDICEHALDTGHLPVEGGQRPHVTVVLDLDRFQRRARGVILDYGGEISAGEMRRLLCDSHVIPAVLGGADQPLNLGRSARVVTATLRRAVLARDRCCSFPGCGRPPARCQVHHIIPWEDGGPTDLDNLALLCRTHHRMLHTSGWQARMTNGHPEYLPPPWLDPDRRPRTRRPWELAPA